MFAFVCGIVSVMRRARSYSIVDHELLHGGYFQKLSHETLALYLFLAVVGDPEGKSFYSEATIEKILRFRPNTLHHVTAELIEAGLISYRKPYWWVMSLSHPASDRGPGSRERDEICVSEKSGPIETIVSKLMQAIGRRWRC